MPRTTPAALLLALLLAACGGASPAPQPGAPSPTPAAKSGEPVTIGFAAQEYEREVYAPLIERFQEENPDIRVQFVPVDDLMREVGPGGDIGQINRRIVSAADTAAPFFVRPEDIRAGIFADLRPLIDADPAFAPDDYQPGALAAYTVDGGLFALPRMVQVTLLSYNRDLLAARGMPEPEADLTWAELLALAEQLAEKSGGEVLTYGYVDWSGGMLPLLGLLGEDGTRLFSGPVEQVRVDDPAVEAALARIAALVEAGVISAPGMDGGAADVQPLIREGRAGLWPADMLFSGPGEPPPGFEVGAMPMPQIALPLFGGGPTYVMSAGTEHPEAAWRWLSFVSRQDASPPYEAGPGQVPARQSLAEQSGYWSKLDEATAAAVRAALERTPAPPSSAVLDGRPFQALNKALIAAAGGAPAADALREAQAGLDEQIAATSATPSPEPESGPVVVTLPEQEVAPEGAASLTFSVYGTDPAAVRAVAREFNRANPDLFVAVEANFGAGGPMTLAGAAESADCFVWFGVPGSAEITATLDLQPLIDADTGDPIVEDYPPALLAPFRHEGGLYGLPAVISLRNLSYNRTLLAEAGIEPPTAGWTLADLLQAAQQITGGEGAGRRYGFGTLGPHTDDLVYFVEHSGGALTTGSGDALRPNYTDPAVFQGVSLYLDLLRSASPHERIQGYEANASWGGDVFQLMYEGRLGLWFDRDAARGFMMGGQQGPDMGMAPPPGLERAQPSDITIGAALFISAGTEQPQACWRWLKHLSADVSQLQYGFPARISAAESEAFAALAPAGSADVYRAYRAALERAPDALGAAGAAGPGLDHYWFFRAADRALQGADLESELAEAQRLAEEYLACVQSGGGPPACATQVDPEYNGYMQEARPTPAQ